MRTALGVIDIVGKRQHARRYVVYILQRDLHVYVVYLLLDIEDIFVDRLLVAVGKGDERPKASLKVKGLRGAVGELVTDVELLSRLRHLYTALTGINNSDAKALNEVGLLAQMAHNFIEVKLDTAGKYGLVRRKGDNGAVELGGANLLNRALFLADGVLLHVGAAVLVDLGARKG